MKNVGIQKIIVVFLAGMLEQFGYTLYLLAVGKYMILISSVLMFVYFLTYLWIINYAIRDTRPVVLLFTYAFSASIGNYIAMSLHLVK